MQKTGTQAGGDGGIPGPDRSWSSRACSKSRSPTTARSSSSRSSALFGPRRGPGWAPRGHRPRTTPRPAARSRSGCPSSGWWAATCWSPRSCSNGGPTGRSGRAHAGTGPPDGRAPWCRRGVPGRAGRWVTAEHSVAGETRSEGEELLAVAADPDQGPAVPDVRRGGSHPGQPRPQVHRPPVQLHCPLCTARRRPGSLRRRHRSSPDRDRGHWSEQATPGSGG